jgi:hypothetical protein
VRTPIEIHNFICTARSVSLSRLNIGLYFSRVPTVRYPTFLCYRLCTAQHSILYASFRTTRQNYILSVRACAVVSVRARVHGCVRDCVRACMILCERVWLRARVWVCVYLNSQNYIETQRSRYYDIFYSYRTLLYVMFLYTMYPIRSTVKFLDPARGSVRRLGYFYSGF